MHQRFHVYTAPNGCVFATLPQMIDGALQQLNLQVCKGEVVTTAPPLDVVLDRAAYALWHIQPQSRA